MPVDHRAEQVELTPRFYVWRTLAKGAVRARAIDIYTGRATVVSSEVLMGATSFMFDLEASALLFTEPFSPFGGHWVAPTLGDLRERYELWLFRHELEEDWTPLRRWLEAHGQVEGSTLNQGVELPLYSPSAR